MRWGRGGGGYVLGWNEVGGMGGGGFCQLKWGVECCGMGG